MSKKDVERYFNTVNAQYHEFVDELKDFEDMCASNIVAPEVIENAKRSFLPVKDNWERLNYIMYLLNKPTKKSKYERYNTQSKKLLENSVTSEQVIDENKKARDEFLEITRN